MRLIGLLLLALAIVLAWAKAPERSAESLVAAWAPPPSDFAPWHDMVVHFRDQGPRNARPPVVLLHGTASSLHTWEGWVQDLARSHRVITLDLPGFGLTGPWLGRDAGRPYNAEEDARFVLDFLRQRGVERMVLGGNSLGGEVAWKAAALAPERVAGLILVASAGLPLGATPEQPSGAPGQTRLPSWLGSAPVQWLGEHLLPQSLVTRSLHQLWGDPARLTATSTQRHFELMLRQGNRAALLQRLAQWQPGRDVAQLRNITAPALILWGDRDPLLPVDQGRLMAQLMPRAELVVLPGLGHVPQEEDPPHSLPPVLRFLNQNPSL